MGAGRGMAKIKNDKNVKKGVGLAAPECAR